MRLELSSKALKEDYKICKSKEESIPLLRWAGWVLKICGDLFRFQWKPTSCEKRNARNPTTTPTTTPTTSTNNNRRAWHKNMSTTRRQRYRTIFDENMAKEKGWTDKRYEKRSKRTRGRSQSGNTHRTTEKDTKKDIKLENARTWWNRWILVQEIYLHSRQTGTRKEQMPTRCTLTWLDNQRKDQIDPKASQLKELLQTIIDP